MRDTTAKGNWSLTSNSFGTIMCSLDFKKSFLIPEPPNSHGQNHHLRTAKIT